MRITSMASLWMLLGVPLLHLEIEGRATNSAYRLRSFGWSRPETKYTKISHFDEPLLGMRKDFQTEVMALLDCVQRLEGLKAVGRNMSICSHSQVGLRALAATATRSRLVWECKEALGRVAERKRLRLLRVPTHTGIRGNEIADKIVSLGARR